MTHQFDALETTHGHGGEVGLQRRQQAWIALAQWLRQLDSDEEGEPLQPSLFEVGA